MEPHSRLRETPASDAPPSRQSPCAPAEKPDFEWPVAPLERTISFLHIGSEIEHA
jgi:hypothetical protein